MTSTTTTAPTMTTPPSDSRPSESWYYSWRQSVMASGGRPVRGRRRKKSYRRSETPSGR